MESLKNLKMKYLVFLVCEDINTKRESNKNREQNTSY